MKYLNKNWTYVRENMHAGFDINWLSLSLLDSEGVSK